MTIRFVPITVRKAYQRLGWRERISLWLDQQTPVQDILRTHWREYRVVTRAPETLEMSAQGILLERINTDQLQPGDRVRVSREHPVEGRLATIYDDSTAIVVVDEQRRCYVKLIDCHRL